MESFETAHQENVSREAQAQDMLRQQTLQLQEATKAEDRARAAEVERNFQTPSRYHQEIPTAHGTAIQDA